VEKGNLLDGRGPRTEKPHIEGFFPRGEINVGNAMGLEESRAVERKEWKSVCVKEEEPKRPSN